MSMLETGRRIVIAHNPHSSRAADVTARVFERLNEAGIPYETIEVRQAHLDENVFRIAPLIQPGDIILSAAGDGSAHAVAHSVMAANKPDTVLGFLAYGNFNDLPNTFNSKQTLQDPVDFLRQARPQSIWPLDVFVNGERVRSALLYSTVGWTAAAAGQFDDPKIRHRITHGGAGVVPSLIRTGVFYFSTRKASRLPCVEYNGVMYRQTDLLFANGPLLARLFRTGKHFYETPVFLFRMLNVRWLLPNIPFLISGLIGRIRGEEVPQATVRFSEPFDMKLQCDGEVIQLRTVTSIEVKKTAGPLSVLTTK